MDFSPLFQCALAVQAVGLVSVVLARVAAHARYGAVVRWLCYLSLAAVGLTTSLAPWLDAAVFLPGGATLGLMVVGSTVDFGR